MRLGEQQIFGQMDTNTDGPDVFPIKVRLDNDFAFIEVFLNYLV
jgi:hypothetical protein